MEKLQESLNGPMGFFCCLNVVIVGWLIHTVFFRYAVATDGLDLASKLKSLPVMSKFSSRLDLSFLIQPHFYHLQ